MKFQVKLIVIICFLMMNGSFALAQTPAPAASVDPDLAVYNAIVALGFNIDATGNVTVPATVSGATASTDTNLANFISVLTNAQTFYTDDGRTAPTSPADLVKYYTSVDKFLTAVNAKKDALVKAEGVATNQANAKTALLAANAAGNLTDLNAKISNATFVSQAAWLKTNATSDVTTLMDKINQAYRGVFLMSATDLPAYVSGLKTVLTSAQGLAALFDVAGFKAKADALAKIDVTVLTQAVPTDPKQLSDYLTRNSGMLKTWRTLKAQK